MYTRRNSKFREFDHTADIGILGKGDSLPALFASLAFGMLQIISGNRKLPDQTTLHFALKDTTLNGLLVQWLSEINYQLIVNHFLPASITNLAIDEANANFRLEASFSGFNIGDRLDMIKTEIKAVTYHQLTVEKKGDTFIARVIFDI